MKILLVEPQEFAAGHDSNRKDIQLDTELI